MMPRSEFFEGTLSSKAGQQGLLGWQPSSSGARDLAIACDNTQVPNTTR